MICRIMTNLITRFVIFSGALLYASPFLAQEGHKPDYSLLWKIEGNGLAKPSYLFGTMHLKDKRVFGFSDAVITRFLEAEALALELDFDTLYRDFFNDSFRKAREKEMFDDYFSEEEEELINEKSSRKGFDLSRIRKKDPITLDYLLDDSFDDKKDEMPLFLDAFLFYKAKEMKKPVIALERYEDQVDLIYNADKEKVKEAILSKTDSVRWTDHLEDMISVYESGDISLIEKRIENMREGVADLFLNERNVKMVAVLDSVMPRQALFIGVGAAHLPGEKGIIALLRQRGYTVSRVEPFFTMNLDSILDREIEIPWSDYEDSAKGFKVKIPYPPIELEEFMPGFNMHVCYDLVHGETYLFTALPLVNAGVAEEKEPSYEVFVDRMAANSDNEIKGKKKIKHAGIPGVEVLINHGLMKGRVRLFVVNKHLYMLLIGGQAGEGDSENAQRFLESLEFSQPVVKTYDAGKWVSFADEKGGIKLRFPSEPEYFRQSSPNPAGAHLESFDQHMYYFSDMNNQELYMVLYQDLPAGYYYSSDSVVYSNVLSGYYGDDYSFDPADGELLMINGVKGFEPAAPILQDGVALRLKMFIRGSRIYLLVGQSKVGQEHSATMDQFLRSLEFTGLKSSACSGHYVNEVWCWQPSQPALVSFEEGSSWSDYDSLASYGCVDKSNGVGYSLNITYLSRYFRMEHIDTLLKTQMDNLRGWEGNYFSDSIAGSFEDGTPYVSGLLMQKGSDTRILFKTWYQNNRIYEAYAYVPAELQDDSAALHYIRSVYAAPVEEFDPYATKAETLLADLLAEDTVKASRAAQYLQHYEFDASETPLLHDALFRVYPEYEDFYFNVKHILLDAIEQHPNDQTTREMIRYYKTHHDSSEAAYVLQLISTLNPSDHEMVYDLLNKFPARKMSYYYANSIYERMADSSGFFVLHAAGLAGASSGNTETQRAFIDCYTTGLNESHEETSPSAPVTKLVEQWFAVASDSVEGGSSYEYRLLCASAIRYFAILGDAGYDQKVLALKKIPEASDIKAAVLLYEVERGLKVKAVEWEEVFESEAWGMHVYRELSQKGNWDVLPRELQGTQAIACAYLREYFYYDDYIPEVIRPVGTHMVGGRIYHLFEFSWEKGADTYLAISGGMNIHTAIPDFDQLHASVTWTPLKSKDDRAKITDLLLQEVTVE